LHGLPRGYHHGGRRALAPIRSLSLPTPAHVKYSDKSTSTHCAACCSRRPMTSAPRVTAVARHRYNPNRRPIYERLPPGTGNIQDTVEGQFTMVHNDQPSIRTYTSQYQGALKQFRGQSRCRAIRAPPPLQYVRGNTRCIARLPLAPVPPPQGRARN